MIFRFSLISILFAVSVVLPLEATEMLKVTVQEDQSLRSIAEKYLGNPNLWIDILRANNLASAADIKAGMSLKIPVAAMTRTTKALQDALETIDKATMAGARLFAPEIIASAIEKYNQAIDKRKTGHYDLSYRIANESKKKAKKAFNISIANQNVPAQAIINYRKGTVQRREVKSRLWNNASVNTILMEMDRVRTLSESYAGVLFRDEKRLRLEENSLALIQKMRSNKLKNTEDLSIRLLEGDLSVFFGGGKSGSNFRLEIPGIETKINSSRFWVSHDDKATRFSNFDGELEISIGKDSLVIGKNQGSVVKRNQKKLKLNNLLPKTNLISPPASATVLGDRLVLEWEPVKGAHRYWVEISNDKMFDRIVYSKKTFTSTRYICENVPNDIYYWRVSAVDENGLPSPKSEIRVVSVLKDTIPPYLRITFPTKGAVVRDGIITLLGEAELGASIIVKGKRLRLDPMGNFRAWVPLSLGLNPLSIEARDKAGNVTHKKLYVTYLPGTELGAYSLDGSINKVGSNHFIVQGKGFILIGKTLKDSRISLESVQSAYKAYTFAGESGVFHLSVPLSKQKEEFILIQRTPHNQVTKENLVVEINTEQPVIQLTHPLPEATNLKSLKLSGRVLQGTALHINGREITLTDGEFEDTIELKKGSNRVRLEAHNEVKNPSIIEKKVIFDQEAPSIQKVELPEKPVKGGEVVRIRVHAKDLYKMKRTASFTIKVSSFVYNGFLILSRAGGVYEANVRVPTHVRGNIKLKKVLLEDYCGNRKEYIF